MSTMPDKVEELREQVQIQRDRANLAEAQLRDLERKHRAYEADHLKVEALKSLCDLVKVQDQLWRDTEPDEYHEYQRRYREHFGTGLDLDMPIRTIRLIIG